MKIAARIIAVVVIVGFLFFVVRILSTVAGAL